MVTLPGMPHPHDPEGDSLPVEPDKGAAPTDLPVDPGDDAAGHPTHPHPITH